MDGGGFLLGRDYTSLTASKHDLTLSPSLAHTASPPHQGPAQAAFGIHLRRFRSATTGLGPSGSPGRGVSLWGYSRAVSRAVSRLLFVRKPRLLHRNSSPPANRKFCFSSGSVIRKRPKVFHATPRRITYVQPRDPHPVKSTMAEGTEAQIPLSLRGLRSAQRPWCLEVQRTHRNSSGALQL